MQLGMIRLGRMGANLARRLTKDGHKCVVYDVNPAVVAAASVEEPASRMDAGERSGIHRNKGKKPR